MAGIRSSGTKIERQLYSSLLERLGPNTEVLANARGYPGRPDVLIPSLRVAIFAQGCFYHCCPRHGQRPASNQSYWLPKLERNLRRDRSDSRRLRALGYSVWRVWEHDLEGRAFLKTLALLDRRIIKRQVSLKER